MRLLDEIYKANPVMCGTIACVAGVVWCCMLVGSPFEVALVGGLTAGLAYQAAAMDDQED